MLNGLAYTINDGNDDRTGQRMF